MQTVAKRVGTYSTRQSRVFLDALPDSLVTVPISDIPLNIPSVEKSDAMFATEDHLVRVAPSSKLILTINRRQITLRQIGLL